MAHLFSGRSVSSSNLGSLFRDTFEFARLAEHSPAVTLGRPLVSPGFWGCHGLADPRQRTQREAACPRGSKISLARKLGAAFASLTAFEPNTAEYRRPDSEKPRRCGFGLRAVMVPVDRRQRRAGPALLAPVGQIPPQAGFAI